MESPPGWTLTTAFPVSLLLISTIGLLMIGMLSLLSIGLIAGRISASKIWLYVWRLASRGQPAPSRPASPQAQRDASAPLWPAHSPARQVDAASLSLQSRALRWSGQARHVVRPRDPAQTRYAEWTLQSDDPMSAVRALPGKPAVHASPKQSRFAASSSFGLRHP